MTPKLRYIELRDNEGRVFARNLVRRDGYQRRQLFHGKVTTYDFPMATVTRGLAYEAVGVWTDGVRDVIDVRPPVPLAPGITLRLILADYGRYIPAH